MKQTIYMENTEISPIKTAGEITELLVAGGAKQIAMDYGDRHDLLGLRFVLEIEGVQLAFKLPVRTERLYQMFEKRVRARRSWLSDSDKIKVRQKAERVAWRQLLRWVQVQLAFIDAGLSHPHEVFMPHMIEPGTGQTLFEYFTSGDNLKRLAAPQGNHS